MHPEPPQVPRPLDRRVQRSRAALFSAAVRLVSERGTAAIPVTDLAAVADVSRQVIYVQFGDRESLLVEAAIDLDAPMDVKRPQEDLVMRWRR